MNWQVLKDGEKKFNLARRYSIEISVLKRAICRIYRGADKSLAQPTSRCILFDGENISFDASLVLYI